MLQRRIYIVFAVVSFMTLATAEPSGRLIRVGTAGLDYPPTLIAIDILTEAYANIGFRTEYPVFPPSRMIVSFDTGHLDALVLAETSFKDSRPDSIQIPVVILTDELVVYSKCPISVTGRESLKPYKIGYIREMLHIEQALAKGFTAVPAQDSAQLFNMREAGRTDVVITSLSVGTLMIHRLRLKGVSVAGKKLETILLYHFLTGKNADIAKELRIALAEMEKSGRIAELTSVALSRLPAD